MSEGFGAGNGEILPELPEDRTAAAEAIAAVAAATRAVDDLVGTEPVAWLTRLRARKLTDAEANRLLERVDWALVAIETLERRLDSFLPRDHPARPNGIGTVMHFLSELRDLASRDREAEICVRMGEEDREDLETLLNDIRHLADQRRLFGESLDGADQDDPAIIQSILDASDADETLRSTHECQDIDQARSKLEGLESRDETIRNSVRALTLFATRLDIQDATLDELTYLGKALTHARAIHPRTLSALKEVRQAPHEILLQASDKKARIERACGILDSRFGDRWHEESLEKLKRASSIANTPGDKRHPKVREYALGIGVNVKIPESLSSVVKTRVAMDVFESDPTLTSVLPGTFRGMNTDFHILLEASRLRTELIGIIDGRAGGDKLMAVFTSNSRSVVNEFLEFSGLEDEVEVLPFPPDTQLRSVREMHETEKNSISSAISAIAAMPVAESRRTMSAAKRLGRMARETGGTARRVNEHPAIERTGVTKPGELLDAIAWRDAVAAYLPAPHTPVTDMDFASLLVNAREGLSQVSEWRSTLAYISATLGQEELASDSADLAIVKDGLESLRGFETAIHAQVHVCEKMDAAIASGLGDFLTSASSTVPTGGNWSDFLQSEYARLDRMRADEAFALEMTQAADDALDSGIDPADPLPVAMESGITEPGAGEVDEWFEEEIRVVLAQRDPGKAA